MKPFGKRFLPQSFVLCLLSLASQSQAGEAVFSSGALTSDATSGVSSSKTYTALGNVVGSNVVVNGVTFASGTTAGTGWSLSGMPTTFSTGGNKTTTFGSSTIDDLFTGFQYAGNPGLITVSGLTVGQSYVTTLYCEDFSWPTVASRLQTMTGSEGGSLFFNEDALEASMVRYTFVASATTMTLNALPFVPGNSFHLYGLSNELVFNKSWTSGSDWTTAVWSAAGTPNSVGANASFAAQGAPATINLDASQTVGHVKFDGVNGWTLSSSNSSVFTLQTDAGGVSVVSTATGSHVISTAVVLGSDLMKSGAGTLTLSGAVSGSGKGVTVTGGLLKLGQTNSYTGATTVNAGATLDLNDTVQTLSGLNGAGTVLNNGSTAKVLTVGSGSFSGLIADHTSGTGTVALTKSTSGTFTVTKPQTYTGATVINDGVLRLEGTGSPLLTDNFSATGNPANTNLNFNLTNRQTGSLATQNWTSTGNMQVGNPTVVTQPVGANGDYLLLASTGSATTNASLAATPLSAANVTGPLKISFDMFKGNSGANQTEWTSFALRSTANNAQPNGAGTGEIGFLYRRNTGLQVFSGGATILDLASTTGGDSFAFYLTDLSGTGSPFGGSGARLVVTQGGVVLGRFTLSGPLSSGAITNRFLSFGTIGNTLVGGVDNLAITVMPSNLLPATNTLNLTAATSAVQLDNVNQTIAKLDGVSGSSIAITGNSILTVNGTAGSSFAGNITGTFGNLTKSGSDTLTLTSTSSSYGGYTVLNGGVLNVASIANYGVNSSIGNRVADGGTGNVGLLFRGGTLQYTGATAQSTNRAIRVSTTGGAIIDASGSDPSATLSFTATSSPDFFENGGARNLTLTGSNTGLNTFSLPIIETGGTTSLTKSGTGTWVLNAASTYTGTTTINGGILSLGSAGAIGSTGTIVFGGGTLKYGTTATDYSARIESGASTGPVSIDTNGLDVVFASGLSSSKTGGLTKTGAGKLTLGGTNSYTGPTTLNTGSLRISTGSTISGIDVAAGTSLEILGATDGQTLTTDSATFAASNLLVDFNSLANPSAPVVTTGTLTLNGDVALSLSNVGLLGDGTIPLIHYTSKSGSGSFTQSTTSIGPRSTAVVSDNGTDIILTVTSDKSKWTGLDSGDWVVGTTGASSNWKLNTAGTATDYLQGDGVLFNDSATGIRTINISAASVLPVSTVFDTAATDYKLTSSSGFGIAGIGPLYKEGSGTVVLTTANTYTGPTTINDGTLQLGDGTTDGSIAGTSAIIINNGTLAYNNLTDKSATVAISGNGGITKTGPGGLTLSGTNTYNGSTVLNAGTLTLGSTTALGGFGDLIINGGTLDSSVANLALSTNHEQFWNADIVFAGTNSLNLGSGFVTLAPSRQVTVTANTLTVGGSIDGAGFSLTKLGAGTLALNGSNSYDGGTTITAGVLKIGNASALGSTGNILFNGGTLQYGTGISVDLSDRIAATPTSSPVAIDTNVQSVTFGTALTSSQSGGLTVLGHLSGTAALVLTAPNSYVGQTSITTDALLRVGANEVIPHSSVVAFSGVALGDHNAKLDLQTFTETVAGITGTSGIIQNRDSAGTGTGTLIIDTAGQNYTFEGLIRNQSGILALVKSGLGTQTITSTSIAAANNFSGGLTINGGTMKLREAGNGRVINSLSSNVTVASGATLALEDVLAANTATTARIISGAGNLEISSGNVGTVNLTGVSTYTGNTTVNAGKLIIATNSATTFADTSTVSIAATAELNLPNAVTDTIANLVINGTPLPSGLYDASTPATSGRITGSGKLLVGTIYSSWATIHVGGDAANVDTDNDGVKNGVEYFMNSADGFTANPSVVTVGGVSTVTWPNGGNIPSSAYGTQFKVQTSSNLSTWNDILLTPTPDPNLSNTSGSVIYTLPTGAGTLFVRLLVNPN